MNRTAPLALMAVIAALVVAPATALGGGWATASLSSLPDDAGPGGEWVVDVTVLQHGRTPLEGVRPAVILRSSGRGGEERFVAKPTGEPGIYRARVELPKRGEWAYLVDDDFSQVHQLGTVTLDGSERPAAAGTPAESQAPAPPAAAQAPPVRVQDSRGVSLPGALGIALGAGLLAALGAVALRRRIDPRPAPG